MTEALHGTILVVDDNETNLKILESLLHSEGFAVELVRDGLMAIEIASQLQPDIILLDIMMPGIDGYETCRRLKTDDATRDIPIIFLTTLSDTINKVKGFEVGAVDFITRPLQYREVLARINTHLTLYRQRQKIEHRRRQDQLYFQKISQMKDEFLHAASHDLRNPLGVILSGVYLLRRKEGLDAQTQEVIERIERGAQRMKLLIANMLDLVRLETGMALGRASTSLHMLLKQVYEEHTPIAVEAGIEFNLNLSDTDIIIFADAHRFVQMLENLLSNAIRHTPSGGHIELGTRVEEEHVVVWVQDDGIGIPADDLPYIFEKFYRVEHADQQLERGTGLGLSIVKAIIEQHQYAIEVKSNIDFGTTFTIYIPH